MGDLSIAITEPGWYTSEGYLDDLARLRAVPAATPSEEGWWLLGRYDDVRAASRDTEHLSTAQGVLVNDPLRQPGGGSAAGFVSILHMDPPVHASYRQLLHREFTPRAVGRYEAPIRTVVRELLDSLDPAAELDGVDAISAPIPIAVIAEVLGIPVEDRDQFRRWSDAVIESPDRAPADHEAQAEDLAAMAGFLIEHVRTRGAAGSSVLALLQEASLDGRGLTTAELMGFCITLLIAGNETTRALISGGLVALAEHPDQRAALVAEPAGIPDAVEEMLRWVTPIQAFCRTVTSPVELAGRPMVPGDILVMLYASANRDPSAFGPTADRFDVARPVTQTHVAFGFGEHLCLGAALARLEARIVFEEVLARFPDYAVTGPATFVPSTLTRNIDHLPVVLSS